MAVIQKIPKGKVREWARRAQEWGYPRQISEREIREGHWYTNEDAVTWFVQEIPNQQVWAVHTIGDPRARRMRRIITARNLHYVEAIAMLLGARKLYSLIPRQVPTLPVEAMRRIFRRYGWKEDDWGSYKLLGED